MKFFKVPAGKSKLTLKHRCLTCFQALSVPARFRLFTEIKKTEKVNVEALVHHVSLRQPTVTFHLNVLSKAGLIVRKKEGREVYLSVRKPCEKCFLFENYTPLR